MTNAKVEFIEHIKLERGVLCAQIYTEHHYMIADKQIKYNDTLYNITTLAVGHTEQDRLDFLDRIDFEYDNGYGGQELFGTIWYEDMTWSSRGEYDGSEWWEYHGVPEIPIHLWKKTNAKELFGG